jgi:hypothetical protein
MDRNRCVELPVPEGRAIHMLQVCAEVLQTDFLVSVPVMKTHMHTGVSLAVKNVKGCLWRRSKVELHMLPAVAPTKPRPMVAPTKPRPMVAPTKPRPAVAPTKPRPAVAPPKPLDIAIADLSSVLRPHLAIVDGTVGMEGLGPSAGRPKPLDAVAVSADAFAADAVACRLMGTDARSVAHLRLGAERGYGVIDFDRLAVTPDGWRDFISPFAPPPENLSIEFPNIVVIDQSSCSACQSTLLLFLRRYQERIFDYFPSGAAVQVAIGKGHAEVPEGALLVGNCTARHRDHGVFVPGCPPVGSQILAAITDSHENPYVQHRSLYPGNA